ncbi:hypothetical protein SAMN05660462_02293 [Proteiniborus ethanoligenes]|uniref:Uncharacterized protein n=1 Tax=Proteiniborus ethanoligenes TaxID=415015 RepID=A0A1H3RAK2_9FIRM|nr:hypothetical protein [Proteiniborus ethanoligenes]SDZ22680.1 hypothetical protein SAMN05660462_02293 [Proteiniborus ethanoligenes]
MDVNSPLICPKCQGKYLEMKREATYLYTYKIDTPLTEDWSKENGVWPFLFDNREQLSNEEYIQCEGCSSKFPFSLGTDNTKIHLTIIQKAIRSDFIKEPEFWG